MLILILRQNIIAAIWISDDSRVGQEGESSTLADVQEEECEDDDDINNIASKNAHQIFDHSTLAKIKDTQ